MKVLYQVASNLAALGESSLIARFPTILSTC